MSHQSPTSSAGGGPPSSPFIGTDPTLYSPDMVRGPHSAKHHRRNNMSQVTIIPSGMQPHRMVEVKSDKYKILPKPAAYRGTFINEMVETDNAYVSRHQLVTHLPDGTNARFDTEHELLSVQHQMKLYACFNHSVPFFDRGVYLRYDDLRDAAEAKDILEQHDFTVAYTSSHQLAIAKDLPETAQFFEFEGQIQLSFMIEPTLARGPWEFRAVDLADMIANVEHICGAFGSVRKIAHVESNDATMLLTFRVEFFSIDAAHRAVGSLRADPTWGYGMEKTFQWVTVYPALWSGERAIASPHRSKPRRDEHGRFIGYRPADTHLSGQEVYRHPADQHNRVRRDRILDGSDVRTTIMLRNIPNKLDWMTLKTILDEFCFGYAFINFSDIHGMIALVDNMERRPWVGWQSRKAAEISYATIQGREALVQKFRNSSVMQETPYCRPRLFLTYADVEVSGELRSACTEQNFPRPDNLSKLQRSMDSARSIGLYPPNGQSSSNEHRHRGSAYDRGTPRDIMHAGVPFVRQAAPNSFKDLTDVEKHHIVLWYARTFGPGQYGPIAFEYISFTHIAQYYAELQSGSALASNNIGVIGGPSYGYESAGPVTTPTRGPRQYSSPGRRLSGRCSGNRSGRRSGRGVAAEHNGHRYM